MTENRLLAWVMCTSHNDINTQLLAHHLASRPNLNGLYPMLFGNGKPLKPGDVVEICGDSGAGKTELLLHWIVQCILPDTWQECELGGLNVGVLLVDNDCHFSVLRLASILESQIRQRLSLGSEPETVDAGDLETLMKSCLQRLYVERCQNTVEFLLSVEMLETLLSNKPNISVIMVDSVSAFYWLDKNFSESKLKHVTCTFQKAVQDYLLVAFVTNSLISHSQTMSEGAITTKNVTSDPISRAWRKIATHKYLLSRKSAAEFNICSLLPSQAAASSVLEFFITDAGIEYKDS